MRVLVLHGYLLRGTGSNVYTAKLAEALRAAGHEVHLLCQDPRPEELPWVDALGEWREGALEVRVLREPVRATVYRPPIGRVLPVYVADRYEGFDARPLPACTDAELDAYLERNVAAVREVGARVRPDAALANHLVPGPAVLARAGVRGAVKVHGSALEYVVKPHPERFLPLAREGVAAARAILVGSRHTAESLWAAVPETRGRTRLGPPGVDVEQFAPREPAVAGAALRALAERLAGEEGAPGAGDAFALDHAAAGRALAAVRPEDRLVAYTGKLIVSKGVDLLLAAWPLVLARHPAARLVVVGFGAYRAGLEALAAALAAGDLAAARRIADRGRELEGGAGGDGSPLRHLRAFLDSPAAAGPAYAAAAAGLRDRVVWCGRLEHAELAELLPACEAQVVPSTFPEAFGMVAAEAAACGVLPVSAAHSGLAEVTRRLAAAVPAEAAPLLSFTVGAGAVGEIAGRLSGWLAAPDALRAPTRAALVATARERFSWGGVAEGVLAAAAGRLAELPEP